MQVSNVTPIPGQSIESNATVYIRITEYDERFPNGCKKIYYKRVLLELFAPYLNDDGVVKRLTMYENLEHTGEICCWQWHCNREDSLKTIEKDFETNQIIENYANGRADSLRCKYRLKSHGFTSFADLT